MYLRALEILRQYNYHQYEISNFCRDGYECKHNLIYWNRNPYLGLGPSSHSFIATTRFWNCSNLNDYLHALAKNELAIANEEKLSIEQRALETIFLSLRKVHGLNVQAFNAQYNMDFLKSRSNVINTLYTTNPPLAYCKDNYFRLTEQGFLLHDEICRLLV